MGRQSGENSVLMNASSPPLTVASRCAQEAGNSPAMAIARGAHPSDHARHQRPDSRCPRRTQFLFVIGAAAGYRANNRKESFHNGSWILKLAVATAVLIGLISVSWDIHESYDAFPTFLRRQLWPFVIDKTNLAPLRLLSFFALAVTATHFLPRNSGVLRCRSA